MGNTREPLPLDDTFDREYEIEWLRDLPSSVKWPRYGGGAGPILRVTPQGGEPFIAVVPGQAATMLLSTLPNPRNFAVFNGREMPVIIDVDRPEQPQEIRNFFGHGLRHVFRFKEAAVIVMTSCCDLVAFGSMGLKWEKRYDLSCGDEPVIDLVRSNIIIDGDNHQGGGTQRAVIDVRTGRLVQ